MQIASLALLVRLAMAARAATAPLAIPGGLVVLVAQVELFSLALLAALFSLFDTVFTVFANWLLRPNPAGRPPFLFCGLVFGREIPPRPTRPGKQPNVFFLRNGAMRVRE